MAGLNFCIMRMHLSTFFLFVSSKIDVKLFFTKRICNDPKFVFSCPSPFVLFLIKTGTLAVLI